MAHSDNRPGGRGVRGGGGGGVRGGGAGVGSLVGAGVCCLAIGRATAAGTSFQRLAPLATSIPKARYSLSRTGAFIGSGKSAANRTAVVTAPPVRCSAGATGGRSGGVRLPPLKATARAQEPAGVPKPAASALSIAGR